MALFEVRGAGAGRQRVGISDGGESFDVALKGVVARR